VILRPEFTTQLVTRLLAGVSINLISPHGQGRRRTLQDLRSLLPTSLPVQYIDLRLHQDDLEAVICACLKQQEQGLLILHNVDLLQDHDLIPQLNETSKLNNINMLYVSEDETHQDILAAESVYLPPLSKSQIVAEIKHRGLNADTDTVELLLNDPAPYTALAKLTDRKTN